MNRIITISREFGSGGHTIGKLTAEKLSIPCYDSELLEQIQSKSGLAKEFIEESGEYSGSGWFNQVLSSRDFNGNSLQDKLFILQSQIIRDLAKKGPCLIVGRCADYILRDHADCLRVFIHADIEDRTRYIIEHYGERKESPEKRLHDKDKRRAAYYQYYTDMKWGLASNYDIALNSSHLGIEKCVDIIASLF